jgi:tRNA-binding protein
MELIPFEKFEVVDIRIGTILSALPFPKARKPAYKLEIDLGELGVKHSSAQITDLYTPETLKGKQVLCVVNLIPRNIAGFISEVLVTGFYNSAGQIVLASSDQQLANGVRLC